MDARLVSLEVAMLLRLSFSGAGFDDFQSAGLPRIFEHSHRCGQLFSYHCCYVDSHEQLCSPILHGR